MYLLPAEVAGSRDLVSTKCPTCKKVTDQEFSVMMPTSDVEIDSLEILKITKRLVICTECGTLRLIN